MISTSQIAVAQDSKQLTFDEFITIVKENHPMSYVSELKGQEGKFLIREAKGGFDPKLNGNLNQKYFDNKQYYSHLHAGLKVPTWFGITVQAGYTENGGVRLNPEDYTSNTGLWNAGLAIQLGNGLFIDERRAELKQAKIYANSTQLEQDLMLNQLIFDASVAYYDWFKAYSYYSIYEEAVDNANTRFENVKGLSEFGDKPSIDTLKALIFLQERQLNLEKTRLELANKRALLEVFLWQDGFIPLELDSSLRPSNYDEFVTSIPPLVSMEVMDSISMNHPEFLISQNKVEVTKIDYRLKREQLKPSIELKYNALSSNGNQTPFADYSVSNYNWGATISYPIFTRKERAKVKLTALKLEQQETKLELKSAELMYKIQSSFNVWSSTVNQYEIYRQSITNYTNLLNSEITLFQIGEGSMFLVNLRDQELIDARLKLVSIAVQNKLGQVWYDYARVNI
ncbi:MAG: TolC family protein [Crocinitomicaceae bacterium]|nr:TolC family protein [Crocinitomicaceae bacterium]